MHLFLRTVQLWTIMTLVFLTVSCCCWNYAQPAIDLTFKDIFIIKQHFFFSIVFHIVFRCLTRYSTVYRNVADSKHTTASVSPPLQSCNPLCLSVYPCCFVLNYLPAMSMSLLAWSSVFFISLSYLWPLPELSTDSAHCQVVHSGAC